MFSVQSILKRFSDHFKKEPESNLAKLIRIYSIEFEELKQTFDTMRLYRSIDEARGVTLDLIGENLNQKRGALSDEMYRVLLKTKIKRNLADGTVEHLISVITAALAIPPGEIELVEKWQDDDPKNAAIAVKFEDYQALVNAGVGAPELITVVKQVKPSGIKLDSVSWDGTFELGDADNPETDTKKGLGDANNPSIGGTLGLYYSDKDIRDLPI